MEETDADVDMHADVVAALEEEGVADTMVEEAADKVELSLMELTSLTPTDHLQMMSGMPCDRMAESPVY